MNEKKDMKNWVQNGGSKRKRGKPTQGGRWSGTMGLL